MRDAFTMRFRPDIAEFVQSQARASNLSVTNFVETLLIEEKARFEERQRHLSVKAVPELLSQGEHDVIRDDDESDAEYAGRVALFGALLDHARQG